MVGLRNETSPLWVVLVCACGRPNAFGRLPLRAETPNNVAEPFNMARRSGSFGSRCGSADCLFSICIPNLKKFDVFQLGLGSKGQDGNSGFISFLTRLLPCGLVALLEVVKGLAKAGNHLGSRLELRPDLWAGNLLYVAACVMNNFDQHSLEILGVEAAIGRGKLFSSGIFGPVQHWRELSDEIVETKGCRSLLTLREI